MNSTFNLSFKCKPTILSSFKITSVPFTFLTMLIIT